MMVSQACLRFSEPRTPEKLLVPKGVISIFSLLWPSSMARQQITSKNSVSRSRDEDVKSDRKPAPAPESDAKSEADGSTSTDDDDENSGVDDEGLEKLMKALGEDGLDEFDLAQLRMLSGAPAGEEAEEDTDAESVPEDEESGDGEEEEEVGEGEGEGEEDIALDDDDVDSVDQDAIPRRKVQVDNKIALERIRDAIKLDPSLPWTETLTVSFPETIDVDVDDDLNRELAFYKQALHGAKAARVLAAEHHLPFTRPDDFFAEMVKTDAHMERIRQRLLDESAGIAKSEARRREREGKKIGKQVQLEKLKEREHNKKDMEERLKGLKRKHKGALHNAQADDEEAFDVAVEDAIADRRPAKRARGGKAVPVCRDMFVTRNLGLVAMGRGISKIHAHLRTTLTRRGREGGVARVGAGVEVGGGEG
ncbi:eukaryotic rRNA processing protein EBP2-domain-containing protein [Russula aff. rugulosa BPL654]|nr:eukaryotic rRNA processing protein EBP2-domain-containing protein [Russula aff. rugulosa BPL654]